MVSLVRNVPSICSDPPGLCCVSRQRLAYSVCLFVLFKFSDGFPLRPRLQGGSCLYSWKSSPKQQQNQAGPSWLSGPKYVGARSTVFSSFKPQDIWLHSASIESYILCRYPIVYQARMVGPTGENKAGSQRAVEGELAMGRAIFAGRYQKEMR